MINVTVIEDNGLFLLDTYRTSSSLAMDIEALSIDPALELFSRVVFANGAATAYQPLTASLTNVNVAGSGWRTIEIVGRPKADAFGMGSP